MRAAKWTELFVSTASGFEFVRIEIAVLNVVGDQFSRFTLSVLTLAAADEQAEQHHRQTAKCNSN